MTYLQCVKTKVLIFTRNMLYFYIICKLAYLAIAAYYRCCGVGVRVVIGN